MAIICLSLSSSLSVGMAKGGGLSRRSRGSISSQAEPNSCHRRDSCHANTPTAIIGALMGLSLTWERGSKGGRWGGIAGEKSVLREICRGEGETWRWRRSSECKEESGVKTEKERLKKGGGGRDGLECKKREEEKQVEWH